MAVGANGDVPPTFPVVMDNPGDQAGLEELQEELEEFQEIVICKLQWLSIMWILITGAISYEFCKLQWLSIMWILITMAISYEFYTYRRLKSLEDLFEELENNMVLANHWSEVKNKPWQIAFEPAMTIDKYILRCSV